MKLMKLRDIAHTQLWQGNYYKVVDVEVLIPTMIKHIKELREDIQNSKPSVGDNGEDIPNEQAIIDEGKIEFIKDFFNITEEDINEDNSNIKNFQES